ncbi:MAG: acyl--CoA ligase [Gammaproteobacteria bacterium]|nr:acyl--CoA ligase [Gammaproteobacteria bacterium]
MGLSRLSEVRAAGMSTVASQFESTARLFPTSPALVEGERVTTYAQLSGQARRIASWLDAHGVQRGDRVALLAENSGDYLALMLGCAFRGCILACQNWRLLPHELKHCIDLVAPKLMMASSRYAGTLEECGYDRASVRVLDDTLRAEWAAASDQSTFPVDPEDPLIILYTSGTTGLPKGAVISHRAELARNAAWRTSYRLAPEDTFVAWTPLYHMGGTDHALATLMQGGKVIVMDGFDADRLAQIAVTEPLGWFVVMPGTVDRAIAALKATGKPVVGVKVCGVMADLIPRHQIAELSALVNAPFANTFGSTETGSPPCSGDLLPIGVVPDKLPKTMSSFCELKLVDEQDQPVGRGVPGEAAVRGPTLFSGYWNAPETNADDFRGGWFHMGDILVQHDDGTFDFVDRAKYMIKSGGENIYPAEIEGVLLGDKRVQEAAVVRQADPQWGEVPVAFVAREDDSIGAVELAALCREKLAGYKQPKGFHFIDFDAFPRSASGKVQRHELQARLEAQLAQK